MNAVGDALNSTNIVQDALSNIGELINLINESAAASASGALGNDEKIALAKAAFRMTEQIQTVVDSTVFGGEQLLGGSFNKNFFIGTNAANNLITLSIDLTTGNVDFNVSSNNFNVNSMTSTNFAGVTGLNLTKLNDVSVSNLGVFSNSAISITLASLSDALNNVNKVAAYLGGISNRLTSQEDVLRNQITNYNAAISRLEDADIALEQLSLIKSQFLQQASLISLTQANQNPNAFLQLLQG